MTRDRRSNRMKPNCPPDRDAAACAATATSASEHEPNSQIQAATIARRPDLPRSMPSIRSPECPDGASAKDAGAIQCP